MTEKNGMGIAPENGAPRHDGVKRRVNNHDK